MAGKRPDIASILAAQLKDVPNSGPAGRERLEYIPLDRIDPDPANFYSVEGVEELAANIQLFGLQQPLRVRPAEEPGRYAVVSGHRRLAALTALCREEPEKWREAACIVEHPDASPALQELRLIFANSDTRVMKDADIDRQAQRVQELLYQLKEEGYEFPGRMRDHVAEACKVSRSKLSRLKVIREGLTPKLIRAWGAGELKEVTAYLLAQKPADVQDRFIAFREKCDYMKTPKEWTEAVVENGLGYIQALDAISCGKRDGGPCKNKERMLEHIATFSRFDPCGIGVCCEACGKLAYCKDACPLLSDRIAALQADFKAQRAQEKAEREDRDRPEAERLAALWVRFGELREAAGMSPEELYLAADKGLLPPYELEKIEQQAREKGLKAGMRLPYSLPLTYLNPLLKTADALGVSLDELLCRPSREAPDPVEGQMTLCGWMPGSVNPGPEPGECAVLVDLGGKEYLRFFQWDGETWRLLGEPVAADITPKWWLRIPPRPEEPQ